MQTFDIVLVEIDLLFYGMVLTKRRKVGMIRQNNFDRRVQFQNSGETIHTQDDRKNNIVLFSPV